MKTLMTCAVSALALSFTPAQADTSGPDAVAELNQMQLTQLGASPLAPVEKTPPASADLETLLEPVTPITKDMLIGADQVSDEPTPRPDKATMGIFMENNGETIEKLLPVYEVHQAPEIHPEIYALLEERSYAMTSSDTVQPEALLTETGYGGIYYESEADVARDAVLTPEH